MLIATNTLPNLPIEEINTIIFWATNSALAILSGIVIAITTIKGIKTCCEIIKDADNPEKRSELLKALIWVFLPIFIALIIFALTNILLIYLKSNPFQLNT